MQIGPLVNVSFQPVGVKYKPDYIRFINMLASRKASTTVITDYDDYGGQMCETVSRRQVGGVLFNNLIKFSI